MSSFWRGFVFWHGIQLSKKGEQVLLTLSVLIASLICTLIFVASAEMLTSLLKNGISLIPWKVVGSVIFFVAGWFLLLFAELFVDDIQGSIIDKREKRKWPYNAIHSFKYNFWWTISLLILAAIYWGIVLYSNSLDLGWVIILAFGAILSFFISVKRP